METEDRYGSIASQVKSRNKEVPNHEVQTGVEAEKSLWLFNFQGANLEDPWWYGGVAQLGEHLPCKQGVKSSNLFISTTGEEKR